MATKISCFRGDNKPFRLTVLDKDGNPVNVAGWSFVFSFARRLGDAPVHQVSGVIEDAANGRVLFELTPTHTAKAGTYYFDVQATTNTGQVRTLAAGKLVIKQDVTP